MCDYQGYEFGASYPDSVCIDGYLWDADAYEDGGLIDTGEHPPCPQCNHREWIDHISDNLIDEGYCAFEDGKSESDCPFFEGCKLEYPDDWEVYKNLWIKGFKEAREEGE